ncbi:MAG: glycoside hydrolase family 2 protein [Candidatus Limnocylindria bacterium]
MIGIDRPTIDLDGEWRFVADPERLHSATTLPDGEPIQVPGCWEAQVAHQYRVLTGWYRRGVAVPSDWEGGRVLIHFGAVMYRCWVWVNGARVGEHEGGYTAFTVDATDAVRWGARNDLMVEVFNPMNALADYPALAVERVLYAEELVPDLPLTEAPHGKQTWYSSQSGIWQSVRMERVATWRVAALRVLPDVPGRQATVRWRVEHEQAPRREPRRAPERGARELELRVFDPAGDELIGACVPLRDDTPAGETTVRIPEPRLWDIGQPNLYRIEARIAQGSEAVDGASVSFGMRHVETRDGQLILNGRPIYVRAALDQDLYPDTISTPPSREYLDRQFRLAREMGLNLLRCHIKAPDPRYLDAADEAGMLLWCELPNWLRFTTAAAARGKETLRSMVETMGNHPSIVIWTIINEDWGTRLRRESRDRRWLRGMYEWLKELDPTRLVVDNSACETPSTPNFHVRTDIADFHLYQSSPDAALRWRNMVTDYASRPAWLWSQHGDAEPRGDEPLLLSEFGGWGLPRLDRLIEHYGGREPWWFTTGQRFYRPSGIRSRFQALGLDRIWPHLHDLAEATQWQQFEALQYQIGELRRHASIQGYVITELTDAYWEANGLLDVARGRKVFHDRLADLNAADMVIADLDRRDVWGGGTVGGEIHLSSFDDRPAGERGRIEWRLLVDGSRERRGELQVDRWPRYTARPVGRLSIGVPDVDDTSDARLLLTAYDGEGRQRAHDDIRLAVLPESRRATNAPLNVAVYDAEDIWGVADRIRALGHSVVGVPEADVYVTTDLTESCLRYAESGGRLLVFVRSRNALEPGFDAWRGGDELTPHANVGRRVGRRVIVFPRFPAHDEGHSQRIPWEGGWVTSFNWMLPGVLPGLPGRNPLDFAYQEVAPEHVLLGYDARQHRDEVVSGMFVGWLHEPAALIWSFNQGAGSVTLTTFRLAPQDGPVATVLLEGLLQRTAAGTLRASAGEATGTTSTGRP